MSGEAASSPPPPVTKKASSGENIEPTTARRITAAPSEPRGNSPAPPSRIVIVPTKTPRETESAADDVRGGGSTITGSTLRVSKEETKSKSIFQKIETKLGLHDDKQQREKADKIDKKSLRKPSSRNERDSIMISRPTSMVHKTHVDREFQWTGENADRAFQLEQRIGGGAYGVVYRAVHKETGFTLAVKVVQLSRSEQDELKKEVDILKKCKEYNIVHYYGTCAKDDTLWILMDYCSVGSVLDLMKTIKRTLTEEEIAVILLSVLKGLSYLHREGIIHRDLKSANILLTENMEPKISDFGVSSQIGTMISSKAKTVVGTPLFMSPEVLDGATHDSKTDIWSVGIMCIELAEGQPPYATEHVLRAMKLLCTEPAPKLKEPGKFTDLFHAFIGLCLQKEADKRPSAVELLTHPFITWIITSGASDAVPKKLTAEYEKFKRLELVKVNLEERLADNRSPARNREAPSEPAVVSPHRPVEPDRPISQMALPEIEERVPTNELPLETIDTDGPPHALPPPPPPPVQDDAPLVSTPSKDSDGEGVKAPSSRPKHSKAHLHSSKSERSPRRQSSTPDMVGSPSLKDSSERVRNGEGGEARSTPNERRIAELESLLDAAQRHSAQLEKQLATERALNAQMEALLAAAADLRAASARFDAACADLTRKNKR